jgi:hypothetical protein
MRKPSPYAPSAVRSPTVAVIDGTPYAVRGAIVRPYCPPPVRLSGTVSPEIAPYTGSHDANPDRRGAMPASGSDYFPALR